jgi:YegS/Rv2252/BmrU family lipid kinase
MDNNEQKVFVVYNPKAGDQVQAEEFRSTLASHLPVPEWTVEIYETTGEEDITAICREACEQGAGLVVSAGGDGTVVGVANALIHGQTPLGILPLGTGNLLARVLNIPLKLDEAVQLLSGNHTVTAIDVLKVGERYFLSNVSVGITPAVVNETSSDQKKRFGMLAYFMTTLKKAKLFNLHHYRLTIDDVPVQVRATEVLVSSPTLLEKATMLYGPPDTLQDGQFEVYIAKTQTIGDMLRLVWDVLRGTQKQGEQLSHWESKHRIHIEAARRAQLVQADGEVIGHTPVEVEMVPKAIHVIMPKPAEK